MITHDTGACVINNGGVAPDAGDDDSGDDQDDEEIVPNQGVIIEEINQEVTKLEKEAPADPVQEEYERQIESMEAEADDEDLWNGHTMPTMFSDELIKDVQSH